MRAFSTLRRLAVLALGLFATASGAQTILYVDADASGTEDGSSWANAYQELDEALEAASAGSQIWVAEGVYKPTDDPDRAESFALKSGVAVLGGFVGTETSADQRIADPDENGTVLSGDIGVADDDSDNVYHVVSAIGVDETAVLDGFLVTGGNADGAAPNERGGGLTNYDGGSTGADTEGYPTLRNVLFEGNAAALGGGMYLNSASGATILEDVEFKENTAASSGGGAYVNRTALEGEGVEFEENEAVKRGGGIFVFSGQIDLRDVEFDSNVVGDPDTPDAVGRGGGIQIEGFGVEVTLVDVEFERNRAVGAFGDGAGLLAQGGTVNLINAVFVGNTARAGAAFMIRNSDTDLTATNVVVAGNQGAEDTWGVIDLNEISKVTLAHLTMSGNDGFAALRVGGEVTLDLINTVLWDNDGTSILDDRTSGGAIEVDHAIIEGGFADGEAILASDPLFVSAPDDGADDVWGTDDDDYGDLRLTGQSPALDFGDLDLVPQDAADLDDDGVTTELLPFDVEGEARVQGGRVDLGAYEGVTAGVASEPQAGSVEGLRLGAAAPNPTRGRAALTLTLAAPGEVEVAVFDALGRVVLQLHEGPLASGTHPFALDAASLPAGVYVVRAGTASGSATRMLTVVR